MHLAPRSFGLRTRLVALVLAPALLLALLGGAASLREHRVADALGEVRSDAELMGRLTDLRSELLGARAPVEVEVRAAALGIPRDTALDLLDLSRFKSTGLSGVVKQLHRLPPHVRPFSQAQVERLQTAIAHGADLDVIDQFDRLDDLARRRFDDRLEGLRARVVASGRADLSRRVDDLEAASDAGTAAGGMVTKLADYWFAILGKTNRVTPARVGLAVSARDFDRSMDLLVHSKDRAVVRTARHILVQKPGTPFERAIDDAIAGRPAEPFVGGGVNLDLIATTFTQSFSLFGPLLEVMSQRSDELQHAATVLSKASSRSAVQTVVAISLVIMLLLVVSLAVAASLERPLSRLIEGTRRVGGGDLTSEPLPPDGPVEIAEASAAFNDVVANLRLLEGKVEALASYDLADPRLVQPLPGALGEALDRSVHVLSGSITDRERLQQTLAFQASHDALTGLHNRAAALDALRDALARARRNGTLLVVGFLDLDRFKQVNDTYSHQTGDEVLREVACRIDLQARAGDFCARLGGDEFVIIAENVDAVGGPHAIGKRIAAEIGEPIPSSFGPLRVGVSVGLALVDGAEDPTGPDPLAVLARADLAAYAAKRSGDGVVVWTETLQRTTSPLRSPA